MTSSDVAESLGLTAGRYEYIERRKEKSQNSNTAEESPEAAVSSHCMSLQVETSGTLSQDDLQEDRGRSETAMDGELHLEASSAASLSHCTSLKVETDGTLLRDSLQENRSGGTVTTTGNTLWKESADEVVDNLHPETRTDDRLETDAGFDCSGHTSADMETDAAINEKVDSSALSRNTGSSVMAARSNGMQQSDSGSSVSSNANESILRINDLSSGEQRCIKTTDALEDDGASSDTDMLTLGSEMLKQSTSTSGDAFCRSVDSDHVVYRLPDGGRLRYETPAQSNNTADGQNSSSETITSLPTIDDLDGLLKVIPKT